jgi:hypothetical protein
MDKPLTQGEKLKVFAIINFYELILSFILGLILNEISYKFFPVSLKDNILTTLFLTITLGVGIITCILYLRMIVNKFPGVKEYSSREGFSHPPPIAMTFGFWVTQTQLIVRKGMIKNAVFKLINSPSVNYGI